MELKPSKDKYGNFININEENKSYFHIYFNNNKEEINRNYIDRNDQIKVINIIIDYQVESFTKLFYDCECVESIYFKKFYRININDMCGTFSGCKSLKELNLSNFITKNVNNMSYMFYGCSSLKELNLSKKFNTNNVTFISDMFSGCSDELKNKIKELNKFKFI
jgi:surface protein